MARYVDGFVLPIPKKNLDRYRDMARKAARIYREHGALEVKECIGDDLDPKGMVAFPFLVKPKAGETVAFSWIVYKSRMHRDKVNAKVMADPRLCKLAPKKMPFDCKRMAYGGFTMLVDG